MGNFPKVVELRGKWFTPPYPADTIVEVTLVRSARARDRDRSDRRRRRLGFARGAPAVPHRGGAARAPGADRRRERRSARRVDGHLGAGARVAARQARRRPVEEEIDEAGNQWFTLRGASERALLIGGHIDSVPNGGWLDGCLNVMARRRGCTPACGGGEPPLTVRLVNWADEEGARFGRSLFGSSAAAGSMRDQEELRELGPRRGRAARRAPRAQRRPRQGARGSDASSRARPPTSSCTSNRARCSNRSACHSASCWGRTASSATSSRGRARPRTLDQRLWRRGGTRWPAQPSLHSSCNTSRAARAAALFARQAASSVSPGIVTSVVETAEQLLDQRHLDAGKLAALLAHAKESAERFAAEETIDVTLEQDLVDRADPLRPRADRAVRRGDPRGDADVAQAAVGPASRRGGGLARGRADGDAVRPEPARPVAHEARGHEGGAPRARGAGPRPAHSEDHRLALLAS